MSPVMTSKLTPAQVGFLREIHAELMGSTILDRGVEAYALKGLLCELTKPEYMAPSYLREKLNLAFDETWTYKSPEEEADD